MLQPRCLSAVLADFTSYSIRVSTLLLLLLLLQHHPQVCLRKQALSAMLAFTAKAPGRTSLPSV
jgi:hypothetical protein